MVANYEGTCGTCRSGWSVSVSFPPNEDIPETMEIECPLLFCGIIRLEKDEVEV